MRFAGSAPVTDFLAKSMDHGAVAQNAQLTRSAVNNAGIDAQGKTAAAGITAAGEVEAAEIVGAAQQSLANAQANAAMMNTIGQIGGAAVGAFGGGTFSYAGGPGSTGTKMGAGGGVVGGYGTLGPNYGIFQG